MAPYTTNCSSRASMSQHRPFSTIASARWVTPEQSGRKTEFTLHFFSPQFLRPYVAILTLVGLNPICTDMSNVRACCSYVQALMVLCVLLVGYVLRYLCGYR